MLKKTITYTDFNDVSHTEDFYFNMTKAELITMEFSGSGNSLSEHFKKIAKADNGKEIMKTFREIIELSVGAKSDDGKRFVKSEDITSAFIHSEAYSVLFMELLTDAGYAAQWVNGLIPKDMRDSVDELTASERARAASEAAMQGRKAPEVKKTVDVVNDLEVGSTEWDAKNPAPGFEATEVTTHAVPKLTDSEIDAIIRQRALDAGHTVQGNAQ